MPWKDQKKNNAASMAYHKKNYDIVRITIRKDSPIPEALERMKEDLQIAPATYAQQALIVQLRKDGYLNEEE